MQPVQYTDGCHIILLSHCCINFVSCCLKAQVFIWLLCNTVYTTFVWKSQLFTKHYNALFERREFVFIFIICLVNGVLAMGDCIVYTLKTFTIISQVCKMDIVFAYLKQYLFILVLRNSLIAISSYAHKHIIHISLNFSLPAKTSFMT